MTNWSFCNAADITEIEGVTEAGHTFNFHALTLNLAFPSQKNDISSALASVPTVALITFSPSLMNASTLKRFRIRRSFKRPRLKE